MATDIDGGDATAAAPPGETVRHVLQPSSSTPLRFAFSDFLRKEYRFGVDPDRPPCKAFIQGHCPLGNACPDKHAASNSFNNLVCKHWLRGLCKKGDACEFLHEYNLRRMPECNFFRQHRFCTNGDDCLYLHIDPDARPEACPHYDRGFCPLGPRCAKRHVRRVLCPLYLAGFCPDGARVCRRGAHARWPTQPLPQPTVAVVKDPAEIQRELRERQERAEAYDEAQRERFGRKDWGAGGGMRGRGRGRGRARGGF